MLSRLVLFLFLVGIAAGCGFSLRDSVPMFKPVGLEDEIKISRDFRREANANFHLIRQPEVLDYVNHIGRRILSTMGPQPYEYRFFIVENPQLNAFAVPGGSIYINSGLIEAVRSTD
ncbi:MAG TPA: M48 family metalloprotease, partial [Candidatus Binatia bacterium]